MLLPVILTITVAPFVVVIFLLANTVEVVRHEGLSLPTLLPAFLAVAIIAYVALYPSLFVLRAPALLISIATMMMLEGLWFFFSFAALLLYSWFYRLLPRKRHYDYIIVHGSGLREGRPTPLLKGRLDKALQLWRRQGCEGKIIVSGGKGSDEIVSEAYAMSQYLIKECELAPEAIILEDRSTNTLENLRYSKGIMDASSGSAPGAYRAALITSDFHVFRASEYAERIGLNADGIGSNTKGYYWPSAFIREFIAISKDHAWPYALIALPWVLSLVTSLVHHWFLLLG